MKIMVMGDVHGRFNLLNEAVKNNKPDIILQVGDFGYWPAKINFKQINNGKTKIYWCDGNHEQHHKLKAIVEAVGERIPIEFIDNVFYCPRGSHMELPDGRKVLFMGGVMSVDKVLRKEGYNWFPEEVIEEGDLDYLPEDVNIDIVISHTIPLKFIDKKDKNWRKIASFDQSSERLNVVYDKYKPKTWFLGHWHTFKQGKFEDCSWTILDREGTKNWFTWLIND